MYIRKSTKRILLIEPSYKAKYPPLGLMKISTYHKNLGDYVFFYKGENKSIRDQEWDTIYITTLFTFHWKKTIETIKFYQRNKCGSTIKIGGILASLLPDEIEKETGIKPHIGLWHEIDNIKPDYSLLNGNYIYYKNNASFAYTTKGCTNNCEFCAVNTLEPKFEDYVPFLHQLNSDKKDLILLDNNVLASKYFTQIIEDIIKAGFQKGAMLGKAHRYVDFNQGLDMRKVDDEKMYLLSKLALRPLRIAFDSIKLRNLYMKKVRLAKKFGIKYLSNYILFNYNDNPDDFYERLKINIDLNEELGLNIFSFPMKYVPLNALDRRYIGPNWTKIQLRGIQCILHATHGVVGPKRQFFEKAFGRNANEFKYIIEQPEEIIFHRENMQPYINNPLIILGDNSI